MFVMKVGEKLFSIWVAGLILFLSGVNSPSSAGQPFPAYYSPDNDRVFWFIHLSDIHIGALGSQDSQNLQWIVTDGATVIDPSFIVASGDLTDSTGLFQSRKVGMRIFQTPKEYPLFEELPFPNPRQL